MSTSLFVTADAGRGQAGDADLQPVGRSGGQPPAVGTTRRSCPAVAGRSPPGTTPPRSPQQACGTFGTCGSSPTGLLPYLRTSSPVHNHAPVRRDA